MKAKPSRRGFLRSTGLVAMGFATGGTIICAADYTWALSTTAIDAHTAETLLVVSRQLFPHDRLGDQYYASVVDALDKQAASPPFLVSVDQNPSWQEAERPLRGGHVLVGHEIGDPLRLQDRFDDADEDKVVGAQDFDQKGPRFRAHLPRG